MHRATKRKARVMDFDQAERLHDLVRSNISRQMDDDREAEKVLAMQIVPVFDRLAPDIRWRLASKIADKWPHTPRQAAPPKPARGKFYRASDGRRFGYTVERVLDGKGRERYQSFVMNKDDSRSDVVAHAKKKDAILRAARLMVEHEVKVAPAHAKAAFAEALAAAKTAEHPDDMWETLNAALESAKTK